jgi:hypothetical protein
MKSILLLFMGAMYANITATQYVDDVEPLLQMNRDNYLAGPHTAANQAAALQYFDQTWRWLKSSQACGSRLLGTAGQTCIADRSRTGRWPWEVWYRDTIVTNSLSPKAAEPGVRTKQ